VWVSLIRIIIEIPGVTSLKDKRRIVKSMKDRLRLRFRVAVAEIGLQDSHSYGEIGAAYLSNSRQLGESVMNKLLDFVEDNFDCRVSDSQIISEHY
jgi:uncharacterized protein YlxP (DUF503 family)